MNAAYGRLAVLTAFALAGVAVLVPAAPALPAERAVPVAEPDTSDTPQSIYAGTAIGVVLEANGNEVPKNGEQMMRALASLGDFVQLPVTFSAVALHTGLNNPRVVITPRVSMSNLPNQIVPVRPPAKAGAKPDPDDGNIAIMPAVGLGGLAEGPAQLPISVSKLTKPNLEGRLFIAANMEKKGDELKVKTFEFISWNSRKQKFDFGFIECDDVEPQIRLVDGVKCFSCHKNRGPILGQGPWSNTTHNDMVRAALQSAAPLEPPAPKGAICLPNGRMPLLFDGNLGQPRRLDTGFVTSTAKDARPAAPYATGWP